jgi:LAS superfamily LD-carboxypeptidase LdcB
VRGWPLCLLLFACSKSEPPAPLALAPAPKEVVPTDAVIDASAPATPAAPAPASFGTPRTASRIGCAVLAGKHISEKDLKTSFVDGDDLLAIVNRSPTGQLPPDWAPSDMVDIRTGKPSTPSECEKVQCLRKDAASALAELMEAMKKEGFPGKVESAFRSYGFQCGTFNKWAEKSSFCEATEQSALPGHSQHQLGTTVDLFTEEWAKDERGVFREGFGCTPAGRWIREHATAYGFVMPYPIHPDDRHPKQSCVTRWDIAVNINPRTGYRYEHWHIRYVGKDAAARFDEARRASGPGTPSELTVEQWLRAEKGLAVPGAADTELPVCDGCNCGACSTLAARGENACDKKGGALHLDERGRPAAASGAPSIASVKKGSARKWKGRVVDVKLEVPDGVVTQPPIVGLDASGYESGSTYVKLAPYPETVPRAFAPIAGAWVIAAEPVPNDTGTAWPWRAAIAQSVHGQIYNRANVSLPARSGNVTVKLPLPKGLAKVKVVLLEGGEVRGEEQTISFD